MKIDGPKLAIQISALVDRAIPIAEAKRLAHFDSEDAKTYPGRVAEYSDTYAHHITAEGIEFVGCEMFQDWESENHRRTRTLVTWTELDHPEHAIKQYKDQADKRKRENAIAAEKLRREQFERLKREFGE